MPKITFISSDDIPITVDVAAGITLMEAARQNNIRGIKAECGGECSCSTCHCYVEGAWVTKLPPKTHEEASLIEFAWEPRPTSRLACQITLTNELNGLVLRIPKRQL
jgi:2Fe-2S ferredoxin